MARFLLALSLSLSIASEENLNEEVLKQLVELIESDDATQSFLISNNNKVVQSTMRRVIQVMILQHLGQYQKPFMPLFLE